jgi:hypothetical protein
LPTELHLRRLRPAEWVAGGSAALLLVALLALPWYGPERAGTRAASTAGVVGDSTGWQTLTSTRWLVAVTVATALALVYFQATRRAPAVPVSLSVVLTVLGWLTVLALIYRVLIAPPGPDDLIGPRVGAYLGLASALGVACGGYASMRTEGIAPADEPDHIDVVSLAEQPGS